MNSWENAINREFIKSIKDKIRTKKDDYKNLPKNRETIKNYYEEIGLLVSQEIFLTFDEDLEL